MAFYKAELEHADTMRRKLERLRGLQALYQEYEDRGIHPKDDPYVAGLRKRIHTTQGQIKAMGGL